jgi:membrane-associated phospholipid phosphatase
LAFVYFAALTVLSWPQRLPIGRRAQISALGLTMCGATLWLGHQSSVSIRDWAPLFLILIGYYVSGLFVSRPSEAFEAWLMAWDRRLLGDPATRFARWPRVWLAFLDILYMGCFLLVPAGFAALTLGGHQAFADRYWTMVVGAELGAFAPLSIIQTRPPWAIERPRPLGDRAVHRLASWFVRQFTICANTFPSGHAAGSLAVAFGVVDIMPRTGGVLMIIALCICLASVVGRYHYVVDVVAGILLALIMWIAAPG